LEEDITKINNGKFWVATQQWLTIGSPLLRACKTITKPKPCFSKTTEDTVAPSVGGRFIVSFKGTAAPCCAVDFAAPAGEAIGVEILTQCPLGPGIFALDMIEYAFDSD
jgi:hypothetical protein